MRAPAYLVFLICSLLLQLFCLMNGFQAQRYDGADAILVLLALVARSPRLRSWIPLFTPVLITVELACVLAVVAPALLTLSYAVQAFDAPLQDAAFLAVDRALGLDYAALMRGLAHHPTLMAVLQVLYVGFFPVTAGVIVIGFILVPPERRGERFLTAYVIAVMLTAIVGGLFPARGAVTLLGPDLAGLAIGATPVAAFDAIRAGTMRTIEVPGGMISFPSMHVALGILILHTLRGRGWVQVAFLPFSLGFIIAAVPCGAHYLADCLAGAVLAGLAILLAEALYDTRRARPRTAARRRADASTLPDAASA